MTKNQKIFIGIDKLVEKKEVDRSLVIEGLEESIALACKKAYDIEQVEVKINYETKRISINGFKEIVQEVNDPRIELSLDEALTIKKSSKIGDDIKFKLKIEKDFLERAIVQSAKQVFRQKLKDAEYKKIIETYGSKIGEVVDGYVEEIKDNYIYFSLDKNTLAVLNPKGQLPGEEILPDVGVKLIIESIGPQSKKGPKIIVSRVGVELIKYLFRKNIPEVKNNEIEVVSIARDAGNRSKISVKLTDENSEVDVVGSCIGSRGSRINKIKSEINGEKIDLIEYFSEPELYIANALAPSLVTAVQVIDQQNKKTQVIVPDDQFSLAIGINGQNARLASVLTGWKIDIKSESMAKEENINYEDDII